MECRVWRLEKYAASPIFGAKHRAARCSNRLTEGKLSLSRKTPLVCILGSLATLPTAVFAASKAAPKAAPKTQDQTQEKRKTLIADATSAVGETQNALRQLDEGKEQDALAALERATGEARNHSCELGSPIAVIGEGQIRGREDSSAVCDAKAESRSASTQTPSSVSSAAQMAEYQLSPAAERDLEGIRKYTRRE
jgi:hypothetical protein